MRIQIFATLQNCRTQIQCLGRRTTMANMLPAHRRSLDHFLISPVVSHGFRTFAPVMATCDVESLESVAETRSKLESGLYEVVEAPCLLQLDCSGVYVHKDGLKQNVVQSLAREAVWKKDRVLNKKLKAHGYGEYDLSVGFISTKYFESREKFDSLYSKLWTEEQTGDQVPVKIVDKISLEEALATFDNTTLACNMEYYLSRREEMEEDLGRKVQETDINNESSLQLIASQLFSGQMIKLFGAEPGDGETTPTPHFRDFRVLYSDGNDGYATAVRSENYFTFYFVTG